MELLKPLIALLAIVNPIGALPFFISFTQTFDRKQRLRTLLMSALSMLQAQPAESKPSDVEEGNQKVDAGDSIAVVPLTIPLLTGPATISTMMIYAERTRTAWELAVLVGYGVVVGLATIVVFSLGL